MTADQFWKQHTSGWQKFFVLGGAFVCLFMGFMTLAALGLLGLIDGLLMVGLGLGIALRRSRACAVLAAAFYAFSQLFGRILQNELGFGYAPETGAVVISYIYLTFLILSIYGTFRWQQAYRDYDATQQLPEGRDPEE